MNAIIITIIIIVYLYSHTAKYIGTEENNKTIITNKTIYNIHTGADPGGGAGGGGGGAPGARPP